MKPYKYDNNDNMSHNDNIDNNDNMQDRIIINIINITGFIRG